jgi:hypothetical protein
MPKLLKEDARLSGLPHRAAQMTVQHLDRALRDCAKSQGKARHGFLCFKKYADRADAFSSWPRNPGWAGRIRLPKIGLLRTRDGAGGWCRHEAGRCRAGADRLARFDPVRGGGEVVRRTDPARCWH